MNIKSSGNENDFGELTQARANGGGLGGTTRAILGGGNAAPVVTASAVIDHLNFATEGNAADFGDLSSGRFTSGASNQVRGVFMAGATPTRGNIIDYVEIASQGNAPDFGDATISVSQGGATASDTRAIRGGGSSPSYPDVIDYITIATTGNAIDFGNLSDNVNEITATGSNTRGVFAGGENDSPAIINTMEYVTIASTGNVTDFGDLTANRQAISKGSCSDNITGILAGGLDNGGSVVNIIEQITIASTGNSTDFGDLITTTFSGGTATNGHGGLSTTSGIQDYNVSKNRAVAFGGEDTSPAYLNTVDYWNISSAGNAVDWGDLTRTTSGMSAVMCDPVRGCCGGTSPSVATIDMIIIESSGNASDFGDLTVGRAAASGLANHVRGVAAGGRVAPVQKNEIDFITIPTITGNAVDFGDLTTAKEVLILLPQTLEVYLVVWETHLIVLR